VEEGEKGVEERVPAASRNKRVSTRGIQNETFERQSVGGKARSTEGRSDKSTELGVGGKPSSWGRHKPRVPEGFVPVSHSTSKKQKKFTVTQGKLIELLAR